MINIGCLYKDNDCIFVAEQILPKIDDERYVLCYKTQLLREDFLRGVTNAYVKCEKPFILSLSELETKSKVDIKCLNCLYFLRINLLQNDKYCTCRCTQHCYPALIKCVEFAPDCELFRDVGQPYIKSKCNDNFIKESLNALFTVYKFNAGEVTKNDLSIAPMYGCLNGILDETVFEDIFSNIIDDNVIIVDGFNSVLNGLESSEGIAYKISNSEFDYNFYVHECSLKFNIAFILEQSKKIICIYNESVFILELEI